MPNFEAKLTLVGAEKVLMALKELPDGSLKALKADLRKETASEVSAIRGQVRSMKAALTDARSTSTGKPIQMFHNGRTGWKSDRITLWANPKAKSGQAVIGLKNSDVGMKIAEFAGTRSGGKGSGRDRLGRRLNGQGQAFISMLQRRVPPGYGGRFLYHAAVKQMPKLRRKTLTILTKYADRVSRKINIL
jgi:hypothetical protein